MVLGVNRLSNESIYANRQSKMTEGPRFTANNTDKNSLFEKKTNLSNDGRFSSSQALKNFAKGLISPITEMFASPKNFAIGTGMIAGSLLLVAATGGAAAPLLVAAGVGLGMVQAGKAVYKISKAKDGDDVENAFYDLGGATSIIGLSTIGAKGSLKQANISAEGLNSLRAIKKCFTSAKSLVSDSLGVFKTGYFKTNLANAYKTLRQPKSLKKFSDVIYKEGAEKFETSYEALKNVMPEEFKPLLKGRNKSQLSIYEKLVKERTVKDKIKKIQNDSNLSDQIKKQKINEQLEKRNNIKKNEAYAKGMVEDLHGARLTLEDTSPKNIEKIVSSIIKAVEKGDIEIAEIENYCGKKTSFYFSESQVDRIRLASENAKIKTQGVYANVKVQNSDKKISGYCAVQLKVRPKGGELMELQIRGKHVDKVGDWEHIPYDLRHGKDIAKGNNKAGIMLAKAQKAIKKMDEKQFNEYVSGYIQDYYVWAQKTELGFKADAPKLPAKFNSILSAENLEFLFKNTKHYRSKDVTNSVGLRSSLPFTIGAEELM